MRVNIDGAWYEIGKPGPVVGDSQIQYIVLELSEKDKQNITNMHQDATCYGTFDDGMTREQMQAVMDTPKPD